MRHVRDRQEHCAPFCLDYLQLAVERLDPLAPFTVGLEEWRDVAALLLQPRDFLARGVLFAFERFDVHDQRTAPFVEGRQLSQNGVRLEATLLQARSDGFNMITNQRGVEHVRILP
jgi:hypothetical protein